MTQETATANLPTKFGLFHMNVYKDENELEHVALIKGKPQSHMLVRIHSSCVTGDIFSSLKCDCGDQLKKAMEIIQKKESGVILYLNQEGRGIGLSNKIRAYALQEKGYDTVEANTMLGLPIDARDYQTARDILNDLGISQIDLITNNPEKKKQLEKYGIKVVKRVPIEISPNTINHDYLKTKREKMSHALSLV